MVIHEKVMVKKYLVIKLNSPEKIVHPEFCLLQKHYLKQRDH